jgi:chromatin segregation and condensation protein Rec8/ScpA/Scc1 (kleisin family)
MKEKRDLLFSDLFGVLKSKVLIVVTFMALLEMVHKGTVSVRQSEDLEIYVSYIENGGESEEV